MQRCLWCKNDAIYIEYHDKEWGVPTFEDRKHFEILTLQTMQAGLSWLTILKKRDNFRKAYNYFEPKLVAKYTDEKIQELLKCDGIIRNEKKIRASINNAKRFNEVQREFGSFNEYIWRFVGYEPIINAWRVESEMPSKTSLSETISKDLKERGFEFVGPTVIYSYLQAAGLINDHIVGCFRYNQILKYINMIKKD